LPGPSFVIAIARLENDQNYNSYQRGYKIHPEVKLQLEMPGIDLSNDGGHPELQMFQEIFRDGYKIVVYGVLNSESIFFEGHVDAPNRIIG
jgi:hypothetical protein